MAFDPLIFNLSSGGLCYKAGNGSLAYRGIPIPDPPTPTPTSGNHWYWRYAFGVFVSNVIYNFENVSYSNGQWTRKYWASDSIMIKSLTGNTIYSSQNDRQIGQWADNANPHPQQYFNVGVNPQTPGYSAEGTFTFEINGRSPGSYPTTLFNVVTLSVPTTGVEVVTLPISGLFSNGPHPVVASGYVVLERFRY